MELISRTEVFLNRLQITAPLAGRHPLSEVGKRVGRIAAFYVSAAFAGALIVAIVEPFLHAGWTSSDENNILIVRTFSGVCAVLFLFVLVYTMRKKIPR